MLPRAKQDIEDILYYIEKILKNPTAAKKQYADFDANFKQAKIFPFSGGNCEEFGEEFADYKKLIVNNYTAFYKIDEQNKQITIYRVLFSSMDHPKYLD